MPVSAIASVQAVTTPSSASSSCGVRPWSSTTSASAGRQSAGRPGGTPMRTAARAAHVARRSPPGSARLRRRAAPRPCSPRAARRRGRRPRSPDSPPRRYVAHDRLCGRRPRERGAHAVEDLVARARHRRRLHHSRKLSRATGLSVRPFVQPESGPGQAADRAAADEWRLRDPAEPLREAQAA